MKNNTAQKRNAKGLESLIWSCLYRNMKWNLLLLW